MHSRPKASALRLVGLALVVASCGLVSTTPPPASPDDFAGITTRLASRGVRIEGVVSGDPGCDDLALARTAIRFDASGLDQAAPATFYLYVFRNRDAFERLRPEVEVCATAYVRTAGAPAPIEISPYVLVTPDPLAPNFAATLLEAITEAAGTGG